MEILRRYEEISANKINAEFRKLSDDVRVKDPAYAIVVEANKKINDLFKNTEKQIRYLEPTTQILSAETIRAVEKLEIERRDKLSVIDENIENARAQLEIAENFEEKMSILEAYGIVDENGKLKA